MEFLWAGRARLYFNDWEDGYLYWSVDPGDAAGEVKCRHVRIEDAYGETVVDKNRDSSPRAWLSFSGVSVFRMGDTVVMRG